ncbi:MAG: ChbG/HpnK family deacetylase [Actinomycetota bacterium]|nr:ChbG/HpnK family deacetylase [Actinomycetota bacterium]
MRLYLTADDAGSSPEVNAAIARACTVGYVNSVSYLVNLPAFDEAVDLVGSIPHVRRSLHLNAVEGRPMALTRASPLVDDDGFFRHLGAGLLMRHATASRRIKAAMEENLAVEWSAQIRAFRAAFGNDTPLNVDSHLHVHHAPFALSALFRAADDVGVSINEMRIAREHPLPGISPHTLRYGYLSPNMAKWAFLSWASRRAERSLSAASPRPRVPAAFCGVVTTLHMAEESCRRFLSRTDLDDDADSFVEILIHPGGGQCLTEAWRRSKALARANQSPWRAREAALAASPMWAPYFPGHDSP